MTFIKPLLVFKAQPEGFDKNDKDWKGDVTKAPGLSKKELESHDDRCDVAFSTKAWMGKQVCEYDVQRILDAIGDENILLQLDGYESYLNALKKVDINGHIREVVSTGDCTDLCSTIDQELGSCVKAHFNNAFQTDFRKRPDAWQTGKVPAKERRKLFTIWTCDAVAALMQRPEVPPEKEEDHIDEVLTEKEIQKLEKEEMKNRER